MSVFDWRAKTIVCAPFWVAWQKCCPSTSPWEFPNRAINHVQHTLYQVLKHGDEPSDCESSCLCYYCYIEGLGLHTVYTARYVIRIKKRLRNRIEIERQKSKSNRIARNMNIYTHKWNEIKLKLMIAITKSLTKDKIDKYILALIIVQYIEDITWLLFHEWAQRTSEIFFQHEKRNFVSPSGHVMFYLLYKHQWNTKLFHFNSFLVWKEGFIMQDNMLFSHVKIPSFHAKAHLVLHWCLYNN